MPELPDIDIYVEKLDERIGGRLLENIRVSKPFLLRSVDPPLSEANDRTITSMRRLGKRIVFGLEADYWIVLHLMVAGRLHWHDDKVSIRGKHQLAAFDLDHGSVLLTEVATKKRASLYLVRGEAALAEHDPGGIESLNCNASEFSAALLKENRTLKRALTNPRTFSGIGNAYSDEILHAARLSPVRLTSQLDEDERGRLFEATQSVLRDWRARLRHDTGSGFPEKVTAFRPDMAVHGKFGKPCPGCQTGGKVLADRSLSRLLKDDWPGTL